jgi:hypothetical protein
MPSIKSYWSAVSVVRTTAKSGGPRTPASVAVRMGVDLFVRFLLGPGPGSG